MKEIERLRETAEERIWLVPGQDEDGRIGYLWCDCPAPGEGMVESESVEYVRRDVVDRKRTEPMATLQARLVAAKLKMDRVKAEKPRLSTFYGATDYQVWARTDLKSRQDFRDVAAELADELIRQGFGITNERGEQ